MPNQQANASLEGRTVVEVELRLPSSKLIPFSQINVEHVRSIIAESIKRPATHELLVRSPTTDFIDSLVRFAQSQGTPRIRYRIGVGNVGQTAYLPWQEHVITDFTAALEGLGGAAGHFCRLSTSDPLFTMSRQSRVLTRNGKISDIVKSIATANSIGSMVVEETAGQGLWIQSFVDDYDFMQKRLIPRAVNGKGLANFNVYVQDNVLHFHSPDYQAALKDLVFYAANNMALTQMDETQKRLEAGASGVRVVTHDPYTGQAVEAVADPAKVLRLGNVITQLANITQSDMAVPYHLSYNGLTEAQNIGQSLYENARSQTLGLKLDMSRSIFLRVGDIVRVFINPSGSKSTVWSGTYLVTDSSMVIEGGAVVASFFVKRGEYQTASLQPSTIEVLGGNVVINDQEAPGQSLNLKSTQSSGLTHGAGQSNFTSTFTTTQDPNAAPNPAANS